MMYLFLKYCWPTNEVWAVLSQKNVSEVCDMEFFKACWFIMTTLAEASHIILEVRENTGKNWIECAIKVRLPNYTDDNGKLNLQKAATDSKKSR